MEPSTGRRPTVLFSSGRCGPTMQGSEEAQTPVGGEGFLGAFRSVR